RRRRGVLRAPQVDYRLAGDRDREDRTDLARSRRLRRAPGVRLRLQAQERGLAQLAAPVEGGGAAAAEASRRRARQGGVRSVRRRASAASFSSPSPGGGGSTRMSAAQCEAGWGEPHGRTLYRS